MMLYSKNGSIPDSVTDGTEGWVRVPPRPIPPEGKEVVWWFPPGWVVRDPEPAPVEGHIWKWSQLTEQWVSCPVLEQLPTPTQEILPSPINKISGNISLPVLTSKI